jgi:outer membrane immunogenic protein
MLVEALSEFADSRMPASEVMLVLVKKTCTLLVAACVGTCLAQAAAALDLSTVTPAPAPQQKPDWAGYYFRNNSSNGDPLTAIAPSIGFSSPTAVTSATNENVGFNFQSGNFVFGLEGSLAAANFDGRFTAPYLPGMTAGGWSPNMNWLGTVTGRIGYSFGQWLPYAKAGFAAADVGSPLQGAGPLGSFTQGTTTGGWTAGLGFEYQLSPKWSLGVEYLYTDLGNGAANGPPGSFGSAPISGAPEMYSTALKTQSFLGRLNYKAGW